MLGTLYHHHLPSQSQESVKTMNMSCLSQSVVLLLDDGLNVKGFHVLLCVCFCLQGLEGEDEGAISMLSDNTAKLTSAVRY